MKKSSILLLSLAFLVTILSIGLASPSPCAAQTPAAQQTSADSSHAQPRITEIHSFQAFQGLFNLAQGAVRVVALVSPTDLQCLASLGQVYQILSRHPSNRLRMYVVYTPRQKQDDKKMAARAAARLVGSRVTQLWDPDSTAARALSGTLGLKDEHAWGTFLLYDTQAILKDNATPPTLWMRSGSEASDHGFDLSAFENETTRLLGVLQNKLDAHGRGEPSDSSKNQ